MSEKYLVCKGATVYCTKSITNNNPGTAIPLTITSNIIVELNGGKVAATDKDCTPANMCFGNCNTGTNPPPPCIANVRWGKCYENAEVTEADMKFLTEESEATCMTFGGKVKIAFHGQSANPQPEELKNVSPQIMASILPVNPKPTSTLAINEYNEEYENIVIVATQQHNSALIKNVLRMEVGHNSKFMFVHQAMREILLFQELNWVVLLCEEGYSPIQISKINEAFNSIKNRKGERTVKKIIPISKSSHIVQYINTGDINGNTTNNKNRKVSKLVFFSHGVVKKILPWMGPWGLGDSFDISSAKKLNADSMGDSMVTYSYACRTGLGNSDIDASVYKDKYKTKCYDLLLNKSLAQIIANTTSRKVYAFLKRTWYGDTLFTSDEYDFLDACDAYKRKKLPKRESLQYRHIIKGGLNESEIKRYKRLRLIMQTFEYVDDAIFCPMGAQHPVVAGKTPEGLSNNITLFVPLND